MESWLYIILNFLIASSAMRNGYVKFSHGTNDYVPETPEFRNSLRGARYSQATGARYGWQNPIRVAPTLPSTSFTTHHPSHQNPQYTDSWISVDSSTPKQSAEKDSYSCPENSRRGKTSRECHTLGSKGSCNENMAFYADPFNEQNGQCDCIQDLNRPLVYHSATAKCYFLFQQAYCESGQWLIPGQGESSPICSKNPCINWTKRIVPNYDWTKNGIELDKSGTVALLDERKCAYLGSSCETEGTENIIPKGAPGSTSRVTGITLKFDGAKLTCTRNGNPYQKQRLNTENEFILVCKIGLFNKWRQEGNCAKNK